MRRSGLLAWGALLLVASACGRELAPSVEACAEILARRMPTARVVETEADASTHVTLDFEVGEWWKRPQRGQLACSFEEQASGGLRLLDATLDGVACPPPSGP